MDKMASASSTSKFVLILFLIAFMILGSQYLILISGSVDRGANVTSSYQGQWNSTRDVNIATISWVKLVAPVLGAVGLIGATLFLSKRVF